MRYDNHIYNQTSFIILSCCMNHKIQKSYVSATSFAFYKISVEILKRIESFCSDRTSKQK